MFSASNSSYPASLAFTDDSTIFIDCSSQDMSGFTLPDIQSGVVRLVVGCDFTQQPRDVGQGLDADSRVVSLLYQVLARYIGGRVDVHSLIIYVNTFTDLHWRAWLELVDPTCFPTNLISLSITASPFYGLSHVMQETHRYDIDVLNNTTMVVYETEVSADAMFLLAGNPMAGLMSSLKITKPHDSQYFAEYYDDHIQCLQNFLGSSSNLKTLEIPLNLRRSLVPLLQFCQELHSLTSVNITPSNDTSYDGPNAFPLSETNFLKETFASTIATLLNLETLRFPAFLMSKQLLLSLCSLPKLDRVTLAASPELKTEHMIIQATAGLIKPLPKMQTLNMLVIEVNSGEEVRVPFHQRTKALAPNAAIQRTVVESNEETHNRNSVLESQKTMGTSLINFRLS